MSAEDSEVRPASIAALIASQICQLSALSIDARGDEIKMALVEEKYGLLRRAVAEAVKREPKLKPVQAALKPADESALGIRRRLKRACDEAAKVLDSSERLKICLETILLSAWGTKGVKLKMTPDLYWVCLEQFDDRMSAPTVKAIQGAYKKHVKRLFSATVPVQVKAAILVGSIAVAALSAGVAAPMIGTAIGGAMGLSGAAATSAGLALLGGGSIASGGLGMAGGVLLVKAGAGAMYKGARGVAISLAKSSRTAFISQLALLHVTLRLEGGSKVATQALIRELSELRSDLVDQLPTGARNLDDSQADDEKGVPAETRRLRSCIRAIDKEQAILRRRLPDLSAVTRVPWGDVRDLADLIAN